jgi:hypothetical protein
LADEAADAALLAAFSVGFSGLGECAPLRVAIAVHLETSSGASGAASLLLALVLGAAAAAFSLASIELGNVAFVLVSTIHSRFLRTYGTLQANAGCSAILFTIAYSAT